MQTVPGPWPAYCQLPIGYALDVTSDHDRCAHCGGQLRRIRTSRHSPVGIMLDRPCLRLIHQRCVRCSKLDSFDLYHQLVPPHGSYAFDLMVEVGLARLRDQRQDAEIQQLLQQRWGLTLPASSIGLLVHSFLDGLAAVHQAHVPELRRWIAQEGGYAMHVDGTCEPDTDILFTAMAEPQGWILEVARMPSENASEISQLMQRCVEHFGEPHAVVRDMSVNIQEAKNKVLPNVPDLICQYHFLENVGQKLCEQPHAKLTQALRRVKIRPALKSLRCDLVRSSQKTGGVSQAEIDSLLSHLDDITDQDTGVLRRFVGYVLLRWLDDYTADLRGEYFPFDLPSLAFYRRGLRLVDLVSRLVATPNFPSKQWPTLKTMARHLAILREDQELQDSAERLEKAAALFEELRQVLRLSSQPGDRLLRGHPAQDADNQKTVEQLQKALETWWDRLRQRRQRERDKDRRADQEIVLRYLEKYGPQLVGHVIEREGREPFIVNRTNNVVEHQFGASKRGLRRKVGVKKLTRQVQAMRPEALLVSNLTDPKYVSLVYGGNLANLPSTIAKHWHVAEEIRQRRLTPTIAHPMPTTKKQLRNPKLLDTLKHTTQKLIDFLLKKPA